MKEQRTGFLGLPSVRGGAGEAAAALPSTWRSTSLEKRLLEGLLGMMGHPRLRVRLWDGEVLEPPGGKADVTVELRGRGALWRVLWDPELHFGDDYTFGRADVDGDLVRFFEALFDGQAYGSAGDLLRRLRLAGRARGNGLHQARDNIHHHYNLSNGFYRLWLDEEMAYTCAYFPEPGMTLEQAQAAKMDHVCRKLNLRPAEEVAEAGCGWGGLARHMARHYGVRVRAYNISSEQIRYARERARAEGLEHLIEYIEDDYREIRGKYDAFISVGMLEHVGVENYGELGQVVDRCLGPNGRGLIHTIGKNRSAPMNPWIERRIFPGARPPTLGEMMHIFEPANFSVLDVENLRLHYARTLQHWLERFEQNADRVEEMFDASFVRAWRFYLASSAASFSSGGLQLFQVLFARPRLNRMPWSRAHLYH